MTPALSEAKPFCLNPDFSTTRLVKNAAAPPEGPGTNLGAGARSGGLRLKGYEKESYPGLPLISVITVSYNAEEYMEETLRSVIEQDYKNVEYIIVDGGSTDRTVEILKKYEGSIDYWVSEKDKGIYDAMNKGLSLATGKYVNFLNASDYYYSKDTLSRLFKDSDGFDVIYGDMCIIGDAGGDELYQKAMDFSYQNLMKYSTATVNHQSLFVSREKAPLYNTRFRLKAELNWYYDILNKMTASDNFMHKEMPVVYYRRGGMGDRIFWSQLYEFMVINYQRGGILNLAGNVPNYLWGIIYYYKIHVLPIKLLHKVIMFLKRYRFFRWFIKSLKNVLRNVGVDLRPDDE